MRQVDLFEFLREFKYWETMKQQFYYIVNPVAHTKELIRTFKETFGGVRGEPELFAIFGKPVDHSKSPLMYNMGFKGLDFNGCYTRYLLEDGDKIRETFFLLGLKGCNITSPHKEKAYQACDEVDSYAKSTNAVNTIVERDGKLLGFNTDAPGFLKSMENFKGIKTVLLLGTGSTARSSATALRDNGYKVTVLGRNKEKLNFFKDGGITGCVFEDFEVGGYDCVINMTSAGLEDENLPAPLLLLNEVIPKSKACMDAIYNKETPFLKLAKSYNIPTQDGAEMLLYQGVLSFMQFTKGEHATYPFEEVQRHMEKALAL